MCWTEEEAFSSHQIRLIYYRRRSPFGHRKTRLKLRQLSANLYPPLRDFHLLGLAAEESPALDLLEKENRYLEFKSQLNINCNSINDSTFWVKIIWILHLLEVSGSNDRKFNKKKLSILNQESIKYWNILISKQIGYVYSKKIIS